MSCTEISKDRLEQIERIATETLEITGQENSNSATDVVCIAKKLGFVVAGTELDNNIDGFIIVNEKTGVIFGRNATKLIGVNAEKTFEIKRFTIAHEIGHFMLHYAELAPKGLYAHKDHNKTEEEDIEEKEADKFAANLLMPKELFLKKYHSFDENYSHAERIVPLSLFFKVTTEAVRRRYKELGLE